MIIHDITIYHDISRYITIYHDISRYITICLTDHVTKMSMLHYTSIFLSWIEAMQFFCGHIVSNGSPSFCKVTELGGWTGGLHNCTLGQTGWGRLKFVDDTSHFKDINVPHICHESDWLITWNGCHKIVGILHDIWWLDSRSLASRKWWVIGKTHNCQCGLEDTMDFTWFYRPFKLQIAPSCTTKSDIQGMATQCTL